MILQKKCLYFVNDGAKGLRDFIRAVPGTVIGGVSGALDEDESLTDGAFKGRLKVCVRWLYVGDARLIGFC